MFCINCFHAKTRVANSRGSKKTAQTWRRRICNNCGQVFTTIESATVKIEVIDSCGVIAHFSKPRLASNIAGYLTNEPHDKLADSAFWLAETIEQQLIASNLKKLNLNDLTIQIQAILARYDPTAGVLYGTNYGLINPSAKARRGRPRYR